MTVDASGKLDIVFEEHMDIEHPVADIAVKILPIKL